MPAPRIDETWITDRLDRIWPEHTTAFASLLIDLRRHFDGDLDAMLILATVSAGTQGNAWRDTLLGDGVGRETRPCATNTQSIAAITGIPRESVRRKLVPLQRKGWVKRDDAGNWSPGPQAASDLRPATRATLRYLNTVFAAALAASDGPRGPAS
jgi:hypothetical protein